jgi:hypothetical protein
MDGAQWDGRVLAVHYTGSAPLIMLVNMGAWPVDFALPAGTWHRVVDTQLAFDIDGYFATGERDAYTSHNIDLSATDAVSGTYGTHPRTIVILQQ